MDIKDIRALADIMRETGLTALEITEKGSTVKLARSGAPEALPSRPAPVLTAPPAGEDPAPVKDSWEKGTMVKSPTVGVFYTSSSPESEPFVKVGDAVKRGDTLCIIEAMKLMNEIPAEIDGTIAEICASNGQVVEFDQPLFRII